MLAPSGYLIQIDRSNGINCGHCVDFGQFKALRFEDGQLIPDEGRCLGCGACIPQCEQAALSLVRDSRKGIPLEIHKLIDKQMQAS